MRLRNIVMPTLVAILGVAYAPGADGAAAGGSNIPESQLLTIETSDKALETVLQWISRRAQVNIVCNETEQPRITLRLANVTWQEAVQQIATKYDLVVEKKSDRIWVLARPPKVRMEFQDARLGVVLEALARQANVNIVFSEIDADKKITMTLNGVPWKDALDVIVKDAGFAWVEREYNIIQVVKPEQLQKDLTTKIFPLNYTKAADLEKILTAHLGSDGKAVVDERSNSLLVTATLPALDAVTRIITSLDSRTRQVLIEMKFVDFNDSDAQRIGFDPINLNFNVDRFGTAGYAFAPFGSDGGAGKASIAKTVASPNGTSLTTGNLAFEMIATLNTTELLQSPSILTLDNQPAKIEIGTELHYAETTTTTPDTGPSTSTLKEATASPIKYGLVIEIVPHITSDGFVSINLKAKNEDAVLETFSAKLKDTDPNPNVIQLPKKTTQNLETTIMIEDGKTGVIGGLLRNNTVEKDGHVPFFSDIPLLGNLFKKQSTLKEKRNLTIFITPRIIHMDNKSEFELARERLKSRLSGIQPKAAQVQVPKSLSE